MAVKVLWLMLVQKFHFLMYGFCVYVCASSSITLVKSARICADDTNYYSCIRHVAGGIETVILLNKKQVFW